MFSARGRAWGLIDFLRGRTGAPPAHLVQRGDEEIARLGDEGRPGTARIDPVTGEASAVPAIGGGVRLR